MIQIQKAPGKHWSMHGKRKFTYELLRTHLENKCVALNRSAYKHVHRFLLGSLFPAPSSHFRSIQGQEKAVVSGQAICKVVLCLPFICLCNCRIVPWVGFARILFSQQLIGEVSPIILLQCVHKNVLSPCNWRHVMLDMALTVLKESPLYLLKI